MFSKALPNFTRKAPLFGWVAVFYRAFARNRKAEQYFQRREKVSWLADVRVIKEAEWSRPRVAAGRSTTTSI
jgi:hypothetical protein